MELCRWSPLIEGHSLGFGGGPDEESRRRAISFWYWRVEKTEEKWRREAERIDRLLDLLGA
jgi:hypothetical protein